MILKRHKLEEKVKTYLLGSLDENRAAQLEQRYFEDSEFFEQVWSIEKDLIVRYLRGRLSPTDRERFERRYLAIPALRIRLEEVRTDLQAASARPMSWRWVTIGASALCIALFLALWVRERNSAPPFRVAKESPAIPVALLDVRLAPGLVKGDGSKQTEFSPPSGGKVRLLFELPGRKEPVECKITLELLGADGSRGPVWTSPLLSSDPVDGGQSVRGETESQRLRPGDYIAEVQNAAGNTMETYSFRVNPPN